jgi:hypothetical protein
MRASGGWRVDEPRGCPFVASVDAVMSRSEAPDGPDPMLLRAAAAELATLLGLARPPTWKVCAREVRRFSVLFRLRAQHPAGETDAFYKTEYPRGDHSDGAAYDERVSRARRSMEI